MENPVKKVFLSESAFLYYSFLAISFDTLFIKTAFVGAVLLLIIPIWGLVLTIKNRKGLDWFCWLVIIFCIIETFIITINQGIDVVWGFGFSLWNLVSVIISVDKETQKKFFVKILKMTLILTFVVNTLTFLYYIIAKQQWLLDILPTYLSNRIMYCTQQSSDGRLFGSLANPNVTSLVVMFSIFVVFLLWFVDKKWRVFGGVNSIVSLVIIVLAKSRGCLLSVSAFLFCFMIVFFVLSYSQLSKEKKKYSIIWLFIFLLFVLLAVVFLFCFPQGQKIFCYLLRTEYVEGRTPLEMTKLFNELLLTGTGRDEILEQNLSVFHGWYMLKGTPLPLLCDNPVACPVHNGFLLAIFSLGIPIGLLYIILLIVMIFPLGKIIKARNKADIKSNQFIAALFAFVVSSLINNMYEFLLIYYYFFNFWIFFFICTYIYVIGNKWNGDCSVLFEQSKITAKI